MSWREKVTFDEISFMQDRHVRLDIINGWQKHSQIDIKLISDAYFDSVPLLLRDTRSSKCHFYSIWFDPICG